MFAIMVSCHESGKENQEKPTGDTVSTGWAAGSISPLTLGTVIGVRFGKVSGPPPDP